MERRARSSPDQTHAPALPDPTANRALISSIDPTRASCHAQMPLLALAASENLNLALLHLLLLARNPDINSSVKRDSEVALLTVSRSQASASQDQDQPRVLAQISARALILEAARIILIRIDDCTPGFLSHSLEML